MFIILSFLSYLKLINSFYRCTVVLKFFGRHFRNFIQFTYGYTYTFFI